MITAINKPVIKRLKPANMLYMAVFILNATVLVLGVVVMYAWFAHIPRLIQIFPHLGPMQFNTALCFCSTSLAALCLLHKRYEALIFAGFSGTMALAVLCEYFFNISLGIDTFFVEPFLTVRTLNPGRMAPNTATMFLAHAFSIYSWFMFKNRDLKIYTLFAISSLITIFALAALSGYAFGMEKIYSWWSRTDMALHTAFGFLLCGFSLLLIVVKNTLQDSGILIKLYRPISVVVLFTAIVVFLIQAVLHRDERRLQNLADVSSQELAIQIEKHLELDLKTLNRMRERLQGNTNIQNWHADAKNYVLDVPEFWAVKMTTKQGDVLEGYSSVDLKGWEKAKVELWPGSQEKYGTPVYVSEFLKENNGTQDVNLVISMPIGGSNNFQSLHVLYSLTSLFDHLYKEQSKGIVGGIEVFFNGQNIFSSVGENQSSWLVRSEKSVTILGQEWKVYSVLDPIYYENTNLPLFLMIVGLILAISLGAAMWQMDRIRAYAIDVHDSRRVLKAILDNTVDGIMTIDEKGIVQSYNKACESIFCYEPEEVLGQNIKMLMPEPDHSRHDSYLQNYMKTARPKIIGIGRQVHGRRRNGEVFPLDLAVAEIRVKGQRLFSGVVRDISERHAYEQRLKETMQDLEYSNRELEQFAYVASHDLKAPLRGIDNLARWIEEDLSDVMTDDARDKIGLLKGRIQRLETMLEDILSYSRAGRICEDPDEVDVRKLLRNIDETIVPGSFSLDYSDEMPVIMTSYTPLQQVFGNLISNAIKHHDKQEGVIKVYVQNQGPYYEFIVQDDGPGIPPEFHERAFGMFQTLQSRDKVEGSGLGMAIIKKLVEWQGGRVWIISDQDKRGTSVHFTWPKTFSKTGEIKDAA